MEKEFVLSWKNSGIDVLRIASYAIAVGGFFTYIGLVWVSGDEFKWVLILIYLPVLFGATFLAGLGFCIASITETSLYTRRHIQNSYPDDCTVIKDTDIMDEHEAELKELEKNN